MTTTSPPPHLPTSTAAATVLDPRIARSRTKVLNATLEELRELGYDGLTVEGVAARSGVAKSTIYRHFEDKADLAVEALSGLKVHDPHQPSSGNLAGDLVAMLTTLAAGFTDPWAQLITVLIDAGTRHPDVDRRRQVMIENRRAHALGILQSAVDRGDLSADVDLDLGVDIVVGWLFYRRFARGKPIDEALVERAVRGLVAALQELGD